MTAGDEREPREGSRWQWAAGAVAILLTVGIVAGLLLVRHRGSAQTAAAAQPAAAGHRIGALGMTAQLDFHCALPVETYSTQALISMPDGGVTTDDRVLPPLRGVLNPPGSSYAGGRWLPVPAAWVSADGSSYAYVASTTGVPGQLPTGTLFVHDVARNADRRLWSGTGPAQMVGWGPGGVYFIRPGTPGAFFQELWAVDPSGSGGAHRVGPNAAGPGAVVPALFQAGTRIAGGAAWTTIYGSLQELAPPADAGTAGAPFGVIRVDLKNGSVTSWFTAPAGTNVSIAAVDQKGRPVLILHSLPKPVAEPVGTGAAAVILPRPQPPRVLLLTGRNQTAEIASGSDPSFQPYTATADAHGVWFATTGSLWLYRQGALVKVADVPATLFSPARPPTAPRGAPPPPPSAMPSPPSSTPPPPGTVRATPPSGLPAGVSLTLDGPCR